MNPAEVLSQLEGSSADFFVKHEQARIINNK